MTTSPTLDTETTTRMSLNVRPAPSYPLPWRIQPLIGEHTVSMVNIAAANGEIVVMAIYTAEARRILTALESLVEVAR